ncbi:carboxypeptidase [SR1 bacterium human oral taxon HOT-345]|nr:carboxypeptidase [SR1 bacterium human oral taxon HOT-345]
MSYLQKPSALKQGDKVAIVSLSRGLLGEQFCAHQLELGKKRIEEMGLEVVFMPNALNGIADLEEHPEKRASDLKLAFKDTTISGIICAIGGIDGFKIFPYLMEDSDFKELVRTSPKVFMGFSDTTNHHLMFYRLGMQSFYGPAFLTDFAEMDHQMLPYTQHHLQMLFGKEALEIRSSDVWYEEREKFSPDQLGTPRNTHQEIHGFELLQGTQNFSGRLLGGCIESLYEMLVGGGFPDQKLIYDKYQIFPTLEERKGKILFIETSEERSTPAFYAQMLRIFKERGIFDQINGIFVGKPQNEIYYQEYKQVLCEIVDNPDLPILYNVNFGHAYPRCILPYNALVAYDHNEKVLRFLESPFQESL